MQNTERLQKVLARAGIASRRHAEALITAGRVRVNGRLVTELGTRVDPHSDKVEVDGLRVVSEPIVYGIVHKPRGVVTTLSDPEGRPTIAESIKGLGARAYPVGRLDFHTSGALLVTNDGSFSQALLHPRHHVPKVYVAKIRGVPTDDQLDMWRAGVKLMPSESNPDEKPGKTLPAEVHVLRSAPPGENSVTGAGATWIEITLREGRTRQIHRMAEATGLFVMRLIRMSFAGITTEGLRPGEVRELTDKEVTSLRVKYLRPIEQGAFAEGSQADDEEPATRLPPRRDAPRDQDDLGASPRPRPAVRRADDRPPPRRSDDKPAPRRNDDRPPPRRSDDRPPPRRADDRPPPRRSDDRPPPRRSDDRPAPRRSDDRPPPRRADDRPPPRRSDDKPAPRRNDDGPPPRRSDDRPPPRRADDRPPPRRSDDRPPPRRADDRPAPRRNDDKPAPRRNDDRPPPRRADERPPPRGRDVRAPRVDARTPAASKDVSPRVVDDRKVRSRDEARRKDPGSRR